ncbi:MAG: ADP-ribosylation factor-like protein [Candidatus Hodarchaeota archaeon]
MGLLRKLFSASAANKKEASIVLLGSSGAGKTTLVRYLETGKPVELDAKTTLGIDIRKKPFRIDGWSFRSIDVGGQELYQKTFWQLGLEQANAVIYIIDGLTKPNKSDTKWEVALFQFEYMAEIIEADMPLLILVNKQDLKDLRPLTTEEAILLYGMQRLIGRSFVVLPSSAKYGDGIQTAMEWLVEKLSE